MHSYRIYTLLDQLITSSYQRLPNNLYQIISPTTVQNSKLLWLNQNLTNSLGIKDYPEDEKDLALLSGNWVPESLKPLALGYAGHQFGHFVPELGDGRAIVLGEIKDLHQNHLDLQLKGSGKTRYSRQGDGRAPLGATIREAILSEAMYHLNIPTTRTLSVISHEEQLYRQFGLEPAGILTRVTPSHLRFGSFQYAALKNQNTLKELVAYTIKRYFSHLSTEKSPLIELLKEVINRQAHLVAEWMGVGFIHGVMNTDNMSIIGETIDYGPCAFMDNFDWGKVFSSIDIQGRYAYGNQPSIAFWNINQLSLVLSDLMDEEEKERLNETLETFSSALKQKWHRKLIQKFGLIEHDEKAMPIIKEFFDHMETANADMTHCFYYLTESVTSEKAQKQLMKLLGDHEQAKKWLESWLSILQAQKENQEVLKEIMEKVNPVYIPRNHLVERAIQQVIEKQGTSEMTHLIKRLEQPFDRERLDTYYFSAPSSSEKVTATFCGT